MLDGVVDQVNQRLLDGAPIHFQFEPGGGRLARRGMEFQPHTLFHRVGFHQLDGGPGQRHEIGGFKFILLAALLDPRKIQHVFNQGGEAAAFLTDEAEIFLLFFRVTDFIALQIFRHQAHRGNGGAQFVGNARNKVGFHLVELLLAAE